MYTNDTTLINLPKFVDDRGYIHVLKTYKAWLDERNIKYSFHYWPLWAPYPSGIRLRNEDALIFKLTFNL